MRKTLEDAPLGKPTVYPQTLDSDLLCSLPRFASGLEELVEVPRLFTCYGFDLWRAYEISWLGPRGRPEVAVGELIVPADSPRLIESKSLKLYLNSFNNSVFDSLGAVHSRLTEDLSAAVGNRVLVRISPVANYRPDPVDLGQARLIDGIQTEKDFFTSKPVPEVLEPSEWSQPIVTESLVTHLLKSNCPVTGQPDWASLIVTYHGPRIDAEALLRYVVSLRHQADFHEQTVEEIYTQIHSRCRPVRLTVQAQYTRRGGIDISPLRSSHPLQPAWQGRSNRQ